MPRITGTYRPKKGRLEDFLVYEMEGELYIKSWTSLTGDRVKTDPAFAVTMEYSRIQTCAAKTSSWVYKQMPVERKARDIYPKLRSLAFWLFEQGFGIETVYVLLRDVALLEDGVKSSTAIADAYRLLDNGFVEEGIKVLFEVGVIEDDVEMVCEEVSEGVSRRYALIKDTQIFAEGREEEIGFVDKLLEGLFAEVMEEEEWLVGDEGPP